MVETICKSKLSIDRPNVEIVHSRKTAIAKKLILCGARIRLKK
jgi:hypothetical protein